MNVECEMDFRLSLKETVVKYGLAAQKALGQNFLLNQNMTDKIIALSLQAQKLKDFSGCHVFEVGPGPGGLTRAILSQNPKKLTVIEADERAVHIMNDLRDEVSAPMEVVWGDALQKNFALMGNMPRQVVSNLPYHISVPLLTGWLKNMGAYQALTLMFQKEVAQRIMAHVQDKSYGRLSVLAQLNAEVVHLIDLNPACFVPAPKVWSSVLLFLPLLKHPEIEDLERVEKLTAVAFSQRRKMIRQSLKAFAKLEEAAALAGVPLTARAEEILPEQYLKMAQVLFSF